MLVLLAGILFLLQDVGVWAFWDLNWYTVAFILVGVGGLASSGCADCCGGCCVEDAKKGRK